VKRGSTQNEVPRPSSFQRSNIHKHCRSYSATPCPPCPPCEPFLPALFIRRKAILGRTDIPFESSTCCMLRRDPRHGPNLRVPPRDGSFLRGSGFGVRGSEFGAPVVQSFGRQSRDFKAKAIRRGESVNRGIPAVRPRLSDRMKKLRRKSCYPVPGRDKCECGFG
jgi:hypothetical protein